MISLIGRGRADTSQPILPIPYKARPRAGVEVLNSYEYEYSTCLEGPPPRVYLICRYSYREYGTLRG